MAEIVIGAVVSLLVEKLASGIMSASGELIKMVVSAEIRSKLQKWSDTLTHIQAVLVDAGQKQVQDRSVELWLNKLQHLAYEIDDVLDDLITEATRHQLDKKTHNGSSKVIKFVPNKLHNFKYNLKMSSKLDGITTKLLDLLNQKQLLGLTDGVKPSVRASTRVEETSLVDSSTVIGREGDKEALLGKLLGSESLSSQAQKVDVVSIVGLGGIGKTTLARLLYNNEKVKGHFELMSWVCVSNEFDVLNISKTILQAIGGGNQDFANLNLLQEAISEQLSKKKFLLVLDDVWNESFNEWEILQRPFMVGAAGSKVIVTTRKSMVAEVMDSVEAYSLGLLSSEEALSLFVQHASGRQNFDINQTLMLYGEDIVKKCGKLPLALRTLGRVFRTKSNVEEWEELLKSEIWSSNNESEILPALKLSYYDLPSHLKQMFVYCCLFPKDYMFDKDKLVMLWMAEGFLYKPNSNKSMESFGQQCFEELLSRSFFQHLTDGNSHYVMHDLINDLATSVAGEFFLMLDGKIDVHDRTHDLEKCHHLSFIRDEYGANKMFKELKFGRRLRTFIDMSVTRFGRWYKFDISNNVLTEVLLQMKLLRVLSLAGYNITEVPHIVCSLKHLRYLNFSNTKIACLPEQVGDLINLQSLLVSGCHELSSFPKSFLKLINLRHLDISDTPELNKMSLGFVGLTGLQYVSKVVIGEYDEFNISDLRGILNLQGKLFIKGLHEVKDAAHAKEAKLQQRKGICGLIMKWSDEFDDSRNKATEYEVLEGLRPFEKLRSLQIFYYGGTEFPRWVGDPSFVCLSKLTLHGCRSCKCLPTLGQLPSLRELSVDGMGELERLDFEFFGRFNSCQAVAFPSLEVLRFTDLKSCKRLPALGHLPSLRKLFVEGMDGLEILDFEFLGRFKSCQAVAFPSLEVLSFKNMKTWEEWSTSGGDLDGAFPCLRKLSMINCGKLDVVAIELISSLQVLHVERCSLKKLEILRCNNLVSSVEKELQSVTEVEISKCERLESYNCPSSIEKLKIWSCKSLTSLSFPTMVDLPSTLKYLDIKCWLNLEVSWLGNNFLSSLKHLCISNMPNLRLFPEGCLVHLTELEIDDCDNIESIPDNGYGFLPSRCLKKLTIRRCKNLKSIPYKHLQSLASLEEMRIRDCPSLNDSFPCGLWPPNLLKLEIGGLKKPISEWGIQNLSTSLVTLWLYGDEEVSSVGVFSFAKAADSDATSLLLPSSLNYLWIRGFKELESVSEGLRHLSCLQHLCINGCPKVRDLPETMLPSLSTLYLTNVSPELMKKCSRKGKYWPIISQIPDLVVQN